MQLSLDRDMDLNDYSNEKKAHENSLIKYLKDPL